MPKSRPAASPGFMAPASTSGGDKKPSAPPFLLDRSTSLHSDLSGVVYDSHDKVPPGRQRFHGHLSTLLDRDPAAPNNGDGEAPGHNHLRSLRKLHELALEPRLELRLGYQLV